MRVSDECAFAAAGVCCCESSVSGCMYVQVLWAYGLSWRCCDGALFVMLLQPVLQLLFIDWCCGYGALVVLLLQPVLQLCHSLIRVIVDARRWWLLRGDSLEFWQFCCC